MEHHIPFRVVDMEMVHMEMAQGNDMELGLEDGKQELGDMGQGKDDMDQHDVDGVLVGGMALAHDGALVGGMALVHDIQDEVDGTLAFLEEDLA